MTWIFGICDGCHSWEEGRGKKAILAIDNDLNRGYGTAVSLPRLIVGTRHCRILIVGNINSDAMGFDITASVSHFPAGPIF